MRALLEALLNRSWPGSPVLTYYLPIKPSRTPPGPGPGLAQEAPKMTHFWAYFEAPSGRAPERIWPGSPVLTVHFGLGRPKGPQKGLWSRPKMGWDFGSQGPRPGPRMGPKMAHFPLRTAGFLKYSLPGKGPQKGPQKGPKRPFWGPILAPILRGSGAKSPCTVP